MKTTDLWAVGVGVSTTVMLVPATAVAVAMISDRLMSRQGEHSRRAVALVIAALGLTLVAQTSQGRTDTARFQANEQVDERLGAQLDLGLYCHVDLAGEQATLRIIKFVDDRPFVYYGDGSIELYEPLKGTVLRDACR